ncbi:MAG: hypothetical protein LBC03_05430 [Nitrososphaerota archaeon]|jgi:hypothetical protein|nr:hypothetical protein [Nitrososphaerota archaeon]
MNKIMKISITLVAVSLILVGTAYFITANYLKSSTIDLSTTVSTFDVTKDSDVKITRNDQPYLFSYNPENKERPVYVQTIVAVSGTDLYTATETQVRGTLNETFTVSGLAFEITKITDTHVTIHIIE